MRARNIRFLISALILSLVFVGACMMNTHVAADEADELYKLLTAEKPHPAVLDEETKKHSADSKNKLAARIARTYEPAPSGKLLARLPLILTEQNRNDLRTTFILNLRSEDPEARRACLYGLEALKDPDLENFALLSLREKHDGTLYAACYLLMPKAKHNPRLWKILQGVYAAHKGDRTLHMSMSFLQASHIENSGAE